MNQLSGLDLVTVSHKKVGGPIQTDQRHGFEVHLQQFAEGTALAQPEQGFRSCIGILGLAKQYDAERLDAACARAVGLGTRSYSSVAAILKNARERKVASPSQPEQPSLFHENIRGPGYYH